MLSRSCLNIFALRGFIFCDIHKKPRKEFEQFRLLNSKNMWLKNKLVHLAPLVWKYTNWIFVWNSEFFFVPHSWRAVYFIVIVLFFLLQEFSEVSFQNLLKLSCTKLKIAKLFLYSISQGNTDLASVLGHGHFECFKLGVLVFAKFLCAVFISPFPPHSHCLFYCPLIANQFSLNFFFYSVWMNIHLWSNKLHFFEDKKENFASWTHWQMFTLWPNCFLVYKIEDTKRS